MISLNCAIYNYTSPKVGELSLVHQSKGSEDKKSHRLMILPQMPSQELEKFIANGDISEVMASANLLHDVNNPLKGDIFLEEIKTRPDFRYWGLGTDLMRAVAMIADQEGYTNLTLEPLNDAKDFYRKEYGFKSVPAVGNDGIITPKKTYLQGEIKKLKCADFSQFQKDEALTKIAAEILLHKVVAINNAERSII